MEDKIDNRNRRKYERVDVAFTLLYNVEKPYSLRVSLGVVEDIDALMVNLSELGMALKTKHNLPLGTELYIKFNIIDMRLAGDERRKHMEITGEVVSNVALSDLSHRIGIRFLNISSENKTAISDFVKRNMFLP
jgi:c-di-GMP-binding flagellar brake protein YcgR